MSDVSLILGTRPEAIKCAPLVILLRERGFNVRVIASGQHDNLLIDSLAVFGLQPDETLASSDANLPEMTANLIKAISAELSHNKPRLALVHGDTATTLAGAISAFYAR